MSLDFAKRWAPRIKREKNVPDHGLFLALLALAFVPRETKPGDENYGKFSTSNTTGAGGTFL